jgi:F-type H+-transporting ATPase subunit b
MKKYVSDRHDFIQTNIDNSVKQEAAAIDNRKLALRELDSARLEANQIVDNARKEATVVKSEIIAQTNEQSRQILESARAEIVREKERLAMESKEEIISIAFAAAEKIIGKNVDSKINKKIIEDFIKQNDQ